MTTPNNATKITNIANITTITKTFKGKLFPSWPASSPWVTAVGGTGFSGSSSATSPEAAATRYGSGGGFAWQFNRSSATWQERACYEYIASGSKSSLPPSSSYPAAGRGTPDVSMISEGFQVCRPCTPLCPSPSLSFPPVSVCLIINYYLHRSKLGIFGRVFLILVLTHNFQIRFNTGYPMPRHAWMHNDAIQ